MLGTLLFLLYINDFRFYIAFDQHLLLIGSSFKTKKIALAFEIFLFLTWINFLLDFHR